MIQPVNNNNIKECVDVIKESFLTVANEFGFTIENAPRFTAFATTEQRLYWQLNHENRPMYAFVVEGNIVGYYSLALQENKECELNNLCVLPQFRHQGIGEKLLLHSFDAAKSLGCSKINIGIVEENRVLKKWYESFGFKHIRTQKFDFFPFTCGYMELIFTYTTIPRQTFKNLSGLSLCLLRIKFLRQRTVEDACPYKDLLTSL